MAQLSRDAARALVEGIAKSHGYLSPQELDLIPIEVRQIVVEALRKKDGMIASSVFTLARNLYSSTARFVFELLQNADDNRYTRAQQAGQEPTVAFSIFHDRLVMECNEDGFTEANLQAICDIGKSSKQGAQGYIGEKGIGFKSTFMAAWKVEIQSGPLSFYFQHKKNESGMGMVTPIWMEPADVTAQTTRMTLYFHDDDGVAMVKARRDEVEMQLRTLASEVLLFLQKLVTIQITSFDEQGRQLWAKSTRRAGEKGDDAFVLLQTSERVGTVTKPDTVRKFFVKTHRATGLAKNDNRTYSPEEEARRAYGTANVSVAFPFEENWDTIVEPQELFAFMPVRKVGFHFLIHSDFVTQANRQDIVTESERNVGLRRAVAVAFRKGLETLCTHANFVHTWMRYLPRQDKLPLDPFWRQLVPLLREELLHPKILTARADSIEKLDSIFDLRRLENHHLDKDGEPLVPDLPASPKYLSKKYDAEAVSVLGEYGLKPLAVEDLLPRLEVFVQSSEWRYRLMRAGDGDWNSRMARLLSRLWDDRRHGGHEKLKWLPILPLATGSLMTPGAGAGGGVLFPEINGIAIPTDIGLSLIAPAAVANADCRKLYEKVGVQVAIMSTVRTAIMKKHRSKDHVDVEVSNTHIRYLYLTDHQAPMVGDERDVFRFFDHRGRRKIPNQDFVYFPGEGEDSIGAVLQPGMKAQETSWDNDITEGAEVADADMLDTSLVHPSYLKDPPVKPEGQERDYDLWLFEVIWAERKLQIFTVRNPKPEDPHVFTKEWVYLARHRPDLILHRLGFHFSKPEVAELWKKDPVGTNMMREIDVLCTDGELHPLRDAVVPLPAVVDRCAAILKDTDKMPFVKYPRVLSESDAGELVGPGRWFEFGVADDLQLSLAILQSITYGYSETKKTITKAIVDLYLRIHAQCLGSDDREKAEKTVRSVFQDHFGFMCSPSIAAKDGDSTTSEWTSLEQCLLDAPPGFGSKEPVGEIWKPVLNELSLSDRATLEHFFRHTLQIKTTDTKDIVDELAMLSQQYAPEAPDTPSESLVESLQELYAMLDDLRDETDEAEEKKLKDLFLTRPFIYVPSADGKRFFKASECVWSSDGAVLGKTCLEPHYPDLAPFFVDFLGVRKLDLTLIMQDIVAVGNGEANVDYVKTLLWSLNTLLQGDATTTSSTIGAPAFTDEARAARVFPVRLPDGRVKTLSAADDFAINDRPSFAEALKSRVRILDFTLAEVARLQPLLAWAGLRGRHLSGLVVETTVVEDEVCTVDRYMTLDLSRKARAFTSVWAHFNTSTGSQNVEAFYTRLCDIKVFIAEQITSTFSITQDGVKTTLPMLQSELHISRNTSGSWDIFLSADDDARDFCIASRLPRELASLLLGGDKASSSIDPRVVGVLTSIIHAKRSSVGRVLEANGIEELLDLPLRDGDDGDDLGFESLSISAAFSASRPGGGVTRSSTQDTMFGRPTTDLEVWELATPPPRNFTSSTSTAQPRFASPGPVTAPPQPRENEQYVKLLKRVVQEARSLLEFPEPGEHFATGTNSLYRFSGGDAASWRRMVGAAGELYVFELLSELSPRLPNFSRANWQSTVRTFASAHPDYADLTAWDGTESSDMYYDDVTGAFTALLIRQGYLDAMAWEGETPEYYIEVKATMAGSLETPFYLSKWQYNRMQTMSDTSGLRSPAHGRKKKLYALFRVYGLESGKIGVKLFLDPEGARKQGLLEFEAEGWTVTARGGAGR